MRLKDFFIIVLCVVIGGAFLTLAEMRTESIHTAREEMGLVANTSLENAPPSLAFATVAMGAFRGIVVDILWMRADKLKEEGKFFDARQLAEWITTLQPRYDKVWDFHAWNMAYNISVAIDNSQPEERWRWVRNGYELLRDRAIPLNPNSILLYRQLAWIFQHKIAGIADDCHRYYKRDMALSIRPLMGDNSNAYFDKLAASPKELKDLLTEDEKVAELVKALRAADPVFQQNDKIVPSYLSLLQTPESFSQPVRDVLEVFQGTAELAKFDIFAKAYQLRNVWKFDIDYMIALNKEFGPVEFDDPNTHFPLNWQHPAAHSLYWGSQGLELASRQGLYRIDEKNTDRIVFHSLKLLYEQGKTVLYESKDQEPQIFLLPDLRMFHSCDRAWRDVIKKYQSFENGNPKAVMGGHKNFLENAIVSFYQAGHKKKAAQLFRRLQRDHRIDPTGRERAEYKVPFETFVVNRMKSELEGVSPKDATEFIINILREGFFYYGIHDDDESAARSDWAQQVYNTYQKEMGIDEPDRMGMPPIEVMRYWAFVLFLNDGMYPEHMRRSALARLEIEQPETYELIIKQGEILREMQKQQQPPQN